MKFFKKWLFLFLILSLSNSIFLLGAETGLELTDVEIAEARQTVSGEEQPPIEGLGASAGSAVTKAAEKKATTKEQLIAYAKDIFVNKPTKWYEGLEELLSKCYDIDLESPPGTSFTIFDIPGIKYIKMSETVQDIFQKISIDAPTIHIKKDCTGIIDGSATIYGNKVRVQVRAKKATSGKILYSVMVQLPVGFRFSSLSPIFKPVEKVQINNALLIASEFPYKDISWDPSEEIKAGVSFICTIALSDDLKKFTDIFGERLNEVTLKGVLTPNVVGSSFSAILPGKINVGLPGKDPIAKTTGLRLSVYARKPVPGLTVPSAAIGIETGLEVFLPWQTNPLVFKGEIDVGATQASLAAWIENIEVPQIPIEIGGEVFLPAIPLVITKVKGALTIDYATAAATEGILTVSGMGYGGGVKFFDKELNGDVYFVIAATTDVLLNAEFKGGLSLPELFKFSSQVLQIGGKIIGKDIDVVKKLESKIPDIGFDYAKVYAAPRPVHFAGKDYKAGIYVDLRAHILETNFGLEVKVDENQIYGSGFLTETTLGPLTITGDAMVDGKNAAKVAMGFKMPSSAKNLTVSVGELKEDFQLYIDCGIKLDAFGGMEGKTKVDIKPKRSSLELSAKVYEDLEALLKIAMNINKPWREAEVEVDVTTAGLNKFAQEINNELQKLKDKSVKKLTKLQKTILEKQVAATQKNINKLETKLNKLDKARDELQESLTACKAQVKENVFDKIVQKFKFKSVSDAEISQILKGLEKEGLSEEEIKSTAKYIKSKSRWNKLLSDIQKTAKKAKKTVVKTAKKVEQSVKDALNNISECGTAAKRIAKWGPKRVEYQALKGAIRAANTSLHAVRKTLDAGVYVTKQTIKVGAKAVDISANVLNTVWEEGIQIKRIYFKGSLGKVKEGKLTLEAQIKGKEIKFTLEKPKDKLSTVKLILVNTANLTLAG